MKRIKDKILHFSFTKQVLDKNYDINTIILMKI